MNLIDPGVFVRILLCLNALACYEYIQAIFKPLEGHASRTLFVFPRFSLSLKIVFKIKFQVVAEWSPVLH